MCVLNEPIEDAEIASLKFVFETRYYTIYNLTPLLPHPLKLA